MTAAHVPNAGADGTLDYQAKSIFRLKIVPADGHSAANWGSGDFGTSPFFGQLTTKHCSAALGHVGCRMVKNNRGRKI
jgi:hypothetical protein